MGKRQIDVLEKFRGEVKKELSKKHKTVEQFCWEHDLSKATLSNFFNNKKDFRVSTLVQIAAALGKNLVVEMSDKGT
jgi:hypothetical protein